jgi:hypothetical protein
MSSAATKAGKCRTYKNWPAAGVLVAALLVSVPTPTSAMPEHAVVLEIDGVIGPATTDYVTRKFRAMKPADIGLIILRVNTPGGLESSMREIIRVVLSSPIPVAAYVAPNGARAASAGTYITYASAIAAMQTGFPITIIASDTSGAGSFTVLRANRLANGNLDVSGRYFLWVGNTCGRADAFMVKVPADLLMGPGSDALPITTTTAAAAPDSLNLAAVPTPEAVLDTVVTLSPADTFLNIDATNQSTNAELKTYTWPDHQVANAILMKFDLSAIPAAAVVTDARLQLALVEADATTDSTYTIPAHKVMGRNPVIGAATGYTADGVTAWTANKCCSGNVPLAQADISAAYDTQAIDKTTGPKSWSFTAMVQEWVADPTTNFGVLLIRMRPRCATGIASSRAWNSWTPRSALP